MNKQDREAEARENVARAERFKQFWENDGLETWYQTARQQTIDRLLDTGVDEDLVRFRLQVVIKQLDAFKGLVMNYMDDGKISRKELETLASGKRPFF